MPANHKVQPELDAAHRALVGHPEIVGRLCRLLELALRPTANGGEKRVDVASRQCVMCVWPKGGLDSLERKLWPLLLELLECSKEVVEARLLLLGLRPPRLSCVAPGA